MKKAALYLSLISLFFIAGCSDKLKYDDDEVAAVVRGEEITIGDLRFLYPDEGLLDKTEGTVKAALVVQEAKRLNLEISSYSSPDFTLLPETNQQFVKDQAEKFGMDPLEYYEEYSNITNETNSYMLAYITEMLDLTMDELNDPDHIGAQTVNDKANELFDNLMKQYEDEIEILIKK